ncbi:hypothetical protein BJ912DRAFT_938171 [Pholiota molesta]|nr:hypothetical protein BJ912DRAFT_938171 [Pholiota molesta]
MRRTALLASSWPASSQMSSCRIQNQLVSNYSQDPGLGIGWAYMVPRKPYEAYVLSKASEEDISTCVGFQALSKSNTKSSVGLRYTGTNITVCGRSEMVSSGRWKFAKGRKLRHYVINEDWPEHIKPRHNVTFIPAIPKLHEPMHKAVGHEVFSLNFIKGSGHSDCECVERVWASHNALANSTKTQGPGSRQDVLDDHFGFWNWEKYTAMGSTLLRRYKAAVRERNLQVEGFRGLTESLDKDLVTSWEKICTEWDEDKFPKTKKNPYQLDTADSKMTIDVSEVQVRKDLAEEEAKFLESGGTFLHATTASAFIYMGLDLEETQRRIRRLAKSTAVNPTLRRGGDLTEQRNALISRIRAWEQLLPIYVPGLLQYHSDYLPRKEGPAIPRMPPFGFHPGCLSPIGKGCAAAKSGIWGREGGCLHEALTKLFSRDKISAQGAISAFILLKQSYSKLHRICVTGLPAIEERIRDAQLPDSLENVKRILKIKSRMIAFKNKNIRGQRDGTRSRAVIDRVHDRARYSAEKYREARTAKYALTGPGEWETKYRVLEDGDVRGYQDPNRLRQRVGRRGVLEDDQLEGPTGVLLEDSEEFTLFDETRRRRDGTGETRRTLSWIWLTTPSSASDDDKDDVLRSEWARSRARATRGREEVMILKEEMRRVLAYLEWKATWWRAREHGRDGITKDLMEGLASYSRSQARLQESLAAHFRRLWASPLQEDIPPADLEGNSADSNVIIDEDEDDYDEGDADFHAGYDDGETALIETPVMAP